MATPSTSVEMTPGLVSHLRWKIYPTEKDWQCVRETFTRLYRDEGKTLKEVADILEREYFFCATCVFLVPAAIQIMKHSLIPSRTRMYKTRIKKWNLDNKNFREAEVSQIFHLQRQRQAAGKRSVFFIRGRKIEWADVNTYLKRKRQCRDWIGLPEVTSTELGIVCRTPSPDPCVFELPPSLQLPDEMFRIVQGYCDGAIDSGVWVRSDSGRFYGRGGRGAARDLRSWARRFPLATTHVHRGEFKPAFHVLNKLFDRFGDIIRQQDFVLLLVLSSITLDSSVSWPELHHLFISFAANILGAILGKRHPLSLLWQRLSSLSSSERPFAITTTLRCAVEYFERRFGFGDRGTLQLHFGYLGALDNHRERNENEIERNISLLTRTCSGMSRSLDEDARVDVLSQLAYEQVRRGNVQDAEQTLKLMLPWIEEPSNRNKMSWTVVRYFYLKNTGHIYMAEGRFQEAGQHYREMYHHSNQHYGLSHDRTLAAVNLLMEHCQELGQAEEALKWQYLFKEGCAVIYEIK
jgi:tetratricopeptide (TPR) repeat protein